jgi:hypothetical protein
MSESDGEKLMGKRTQGSFERQPRDHYVTPYPAVPPLIPHLRGIKKFAEPCCGDGSLIRHLESFGMRCVYQGDIAGGRDALTAKSFGDSTIIITNPPYSRHTMHALIAHFARISPAWLLMELDWSATRQAIPFMPMCSDIVAIGRVRWIAGTKMSSYENFAWYRFDEAHRGSTYFHARS